ncbi:helix-turn-helix domain-containing protein, partial [Actinotignum urinale]
MDNTKLVLKTILSSKVPPSRADVAASTGLTRATVSRLVDSLLDCDIISELPPVKSAIGRPASPLVP